ncbi:maleylacetate reductase [Mesorhizobium sp. INR15]|uniref:maleylacetate reductase n=1 Tax=Mesorhizobium sp. INR15 TaxID=2654248 RepID=UPI001896722C|nr:maleylacetate reductase [Mesorhizobium sp. INR15]QPC94435.1 iron-containing alcohol dehydrogenase [Mesorhizobium sp. INR15]
MHGFVYNANPARVLFGSGTLAQLPSEAQRLGLNRVLILSTPRQRLAGQVAALLGDRAAGIFAEAAMHTPLHTTRAAMAVVADLRIDGVVAVGGGSTIGLGKAIALRTDLPQIVIPTTYAGSEMTSVLGETVDGAKITQTDRKILPEAVIYDVDLTLALPTLISGTSGINAIAHAVEALYARNRNPVVDLMAAEGIGALARALPRIVEKPGDQEARSLALYGAWLCGMCLGAVGMALHHKLCHTLGGLLGLPHAETHTIVLPHALAYNAGAAPQAVAKIAAALGVRDAALGLYDLAGAVGARRALKDIGMSRPHIEEAVGRALENPYWNPRPLEQDALRALVTRAYEGVAPQE